MSYDMFRLWYFFILSAVYDFVTENSARTLIDTVRALYNVHTHTC